MKCRFCGRVLEEVFLDLGNAPPSNAFLDQEALSRPEVFYPLKLFVCARCFLVQVDEHKRSSEIFGKDYPYFSSFSRTWLKHAEDFAKTITSRLGLGPSSLVVEIGANDGYLLQYFREMGVPCLGVEPTRGPAEAARAKGIQVVEDYFSRKTAGRLHGEVGQADLVVLNNVLAHVPDLHDFVEGIRILLKPGGTVTAEFPHLMRLIHENQFDTVYHEHFSYFSFSTARRVFMAHALTVYDVEEIRTHGGSLRLYACHSNGSPWPTSQSVPELIDKEALAGMTSIDHYKDFQAKVDRVKNDLLEFLIAQNKRGARVVAYGAAAKGNTLFNYCGVKKDLVPFVVDVSPHKQGKFLPGSHIPVVGVDRISEVQPDFVLILPWNILGEIMEEIGYIRSWGGRFVVAIPGLHVLP